ncbi:MAG: HAD-IA family hydrolase [Spirochaetes bacterium]|nr:HAD-IA family hydrolase [Spirochaetota bacterium]
MSSKLRAQRGIKAVIFDADGVLQTYGDFPEYAEKKYGWDAKNYFDTLHSLFHDSRDYDRTLTGKGDAVSVLRGILPSFGWNHSAALFLREWVSRNIVVRQRMVESVARIRKCSIRCYMATNQERHRARHMMRMAAYKDAFDAMFFSCDLGTKKPAERYFRKVVHAIALDPENILFFDDHEGNISAARRIGMHAELYTDYRTYCGHVKKYIPSLVRSSKR